MYSYLISSNLDSGLFTAELKDTVLTADSKLGLEEKVHLHHYKNLKDTKKSAAR